MKREKSDSPPTSSSSQGSGLKRTRPDKGNQARSDFNIEPENQSTATPTSGYQMYRAPAAHMYSREGSVASVEYVQQPIETSQQVEDDGSRNTHASFSSADILCTDRIFNSDPAPTDYGRTRSGAEYKSIMRGPQTTTLPASSSCSKSAKNQPHEKQKAPILVAEEHFPPILVPIEGGGHKFKCGRCKASWDTNDEHYDHACHGFEIGTPLSD